MRGGLEVALAGFGGGCEVVSGRCGLTSRGAPRAAVDGDSRRGLTRLAPGLMKAAAGADGGSGCPPRPRLEL